ncbi:MAG: hypothetical protein ABJA80_03885, partial [bacterium]
MIVRRRTLVSLAVLATAVGVVPHRRGPTAGPLTVRHAAAHDTSSPLRDAAAPPRARDVMRVPAFVLSPGDDDDEARGDTITARAHAVPVGSAAVEQIAQGTRPGPLLVSRFDGLGVGFAGPQGAAALRNPSDNSLAVGPDHIVQIVNTRMAVFTKKGARYDRTGVVLYGAVETRNVFKGFGGPCELRNNGDAVVRYDQLARRWLIVMPIFSRVPKRAVEPVPARDGEPARRSMRGQPGQPGAARELDQPRALPRDSQGIAPTFVPRAPGQARPPADSGSYAMCYAVSTGQDPLGSYYRYEFVRPLFPDYPRPAVW